jgi:hypothetical protein
MMELLLQKLLISKIAWGSRILRTEGRVQSFILLLRGKNRLYLIRQLYLKSKDVNICEQCQKIIVLDIFALWF